MNPTSKHQPPKQLQTSMPSTITHSYKQSPAASEYDQSTDTSHKINNRAHLRITIRRAAEPGQNARNAVWGWSGC